MRDERDEKIKHKKLDNPDLLNTEKESIFDIDEEMRFVDPIPMEELNDQVKDERRPADTKKTSGSERKNRQDVDR